MYIAILALALCLLVLVLSVAAVQRKQTEPMEYVQFRETVGGMALVPWQNGEIWYLFLPSHAGPEDLRITTTAGIRATLEETGTLRVQTPLRTREYTLEIRQNTNLPTLSLDIEAGTLEHIHSSIDHKKDVFATMTDADGNVLLQKIATISGRGNGTWRGEKRPYNLVFSENISVGPFQNISRLCLLAESYDESKLRNSLAYFAGQNLDMDYPSAYLHCNLYVGGEYRGIYGIATKQEYEKHIQQDGIQAVFEYTSYPKENQFYTFPGLQPIRVLYGNLEETSYVVNDFCEALAAQDWERCAQLVDLRSFAKKYVMDQFFLNYDGTFSSQYFYIDAEGVIRTMLPWDYDWSMGSSYRYYRIPAPSDEIIEVFPEYWSVQLLANPDFCEEIVDVTKTWYRSEFFQKLEKHMMQTIDLIADSLDNEVIRWWGENEWILYQGTPNREHLNLLCEQFSLYYPRRRDFLIHHFGDEDTPWVNDETVLVYNELAPLQQAVEEVTTPELDTGWMNWGILGGTVFVGLTLLGTELLRHHRKPRKKEEVAV